MHRSMFTRPPLCAFVSSSLSFTKSKNFLHSSSFSCLCNSSPTLSIPVSCLSTRETAKQGRTLKKVLVTHGQTMLWTIFITDKRGCEHTQHTPSVQHAHFRSDQHMFFGGLFYYLGFFNLKHVILKSAYFSLKGYVRKDICLGLFQITDYAGFQAISALLLIV